MFFVKYLENSYSLGIWYDSLVTGQCDKSIKAQCYWLSDLSVVKPRCYMVMKSLNGFFYFLSIRMIYFVVIWRRFNAEAENIRIWPDGVTNWYTHILNKLMSFNGLLL